MEQPRLVRGDVAAEVARLQAAARQGYGHLWRGGCLAQEFVRLGLVDEYGLVINPVLLGKGLPLFKDVPARQNLRRISGNILKDGTVALRYAPR